MSELTANQTGGMYDEVVEIQNLNKVEGFDPRKYMRIIQKEGQARKYYLDVVYRKLWFRLKYPEGKIVKKILKLTEQMAIVEAKVYLSRNDAEDSFISNAMAQKYMTPDSEFGSKYVELAETAAVGRALADAGFGLQFADKEGEADPEITDAPLDAGVFSGGMPMPEGTYMDEELMNPQTEADISTSGGISDNDMPGQYGIESYIPTPNDVMQAAQNQQPINTQLANQQMQTMQGNIPLQNQQNFIPSQQTIQQMPTGNLSMSVPTPAMQQNIQQNTGAGIPPANNQSQTQRGTAAPKAIDKKMPVEQIYSMLNRETAAAVVVPIGVFKNKTLGQIAMEKPASLEWYITSYGGPDNLLRAAAKFLMDAALGQAS